MEAKTQIYLTRAQLQVIGNMFDIAVRTQGLQVVAKIAPVLEILDKAITELNKLEKE